MTLQPEPAPSPLERVRACLEAIYDSPTAIATLEQIAAHLHAAHIPTTHAAEYLSERSITLITYGDTLRRDGQMPLQTLHQFMRERLAHVVDTVHILPFYPWSSDDGFSVIDYKAVDPVLGDWADVEALGADFRLMADAVINHMSAGSDWFKAFLADEPAFRHRFFIESPQADLRDVVRPRTSPLLTPFPRAGGQTVHVWTTFSADQVDLDYRDPQTLLSILDVLLFYVSKGARVIRLDAIAFMWKQAGTSCVHLPQTHAIIRLFRAALDAVAPQAVLITETNVPHAENISYFGEGTDEAQLVYNFTLPPLLLHTLITEDAAKLVDWINGLNTPSSHTAFFNFTASHDGIGLRPVEGILTPDEVTALVALAKQRGGRVSLRRNPDGTDSPYELNVTYVDACADPDLPIDLQVRRFLLSQAVMLALAGVPAVYIHSLLGSRNDIAGMVDSEINRRINRAKLDVDAVSAELNTPGSFRARVFDAYCALIRARTACRAFHPAGAQRARSANSGRVLWLERTSPDHAEHVIALFNLSHSESHIASVPGGQVLNTGAAFSGGTLTLAPYDVCWIKAGSV